MSVKLIARRKKVAALKIPWDKYRIIINDIKPCHWFSCLNIRNPNGTLQIIELDFYHFCFYFKVSPSFDSVIV